MPDLHILRDLLILIAFAIPVVAVAQRLRAPSTVGFLIAGILIGPHVLGLIERSEEVQVIAEIGVVLLLFEIGLEMSFSRVVRMWTTVLIGGGLQLVVTIAAATALSVVFGLQWRPALTFGCLLALSSTAIVLKALSDRRELDTPYGRVVVGTLLFQDLAVVPLIVVVGVLGPGSPSTLAGGVRQIAISLGVLAGVVVTARFIIPVVLARIAGLQNRELFTLTVGLFGLGAAYATASVGLAMALGAFVAGLVISESEYGAQALSDVLPFRVLFSGIFFTSVGMLLDLGFIVENAGVVAGTAVGVVVGKAAVVVVIVRFALRMPFGVAVAAGVALAQVGEFSFVLATVAIGAQVIEPALYQLFLSATVISMLMTPALIAGGQRAGSALARRSGLGAPDTTTGGPELKDHAIIVGFGLAGRHLARVLRAAHVPYVILELDDELVRNARDEGEPIYFGDGSSREVLGKAGINNARVLIFLISSIMDERRGVTAARALSATIKILVRTRSVVAMRELIPAGATDVVVEEYEAALELFQRVMRHYCIPSNTIQAELDAMRTEGYGILRGLPKEALHLDELNFLGIQHALELMAVEKGSPAVGRSLRDLGLRKETKCTVVAVIRDAVPEYDIGPDFVFEAEDTVVLVGPGPGLPRGAERFRAPRAE